MLETQSIEWFEGVSTNNNATEGVLASNNDGSIFTNISDGINELISIEIRNNTILSVPQDSVTEGIQSKNEK
jgi:hypothetical protein